MKTYYIEGQKKIRYQYNCILHNCILHFEYPPNDKSL